MDAIWTQWDKEPTLYPTLDGDIDADVVVIGAGITGLTTAQRLAEAGINVVVLEASTVGGGSTGGSTGNLYSTVATGLGPIRRKWNDEVVNEVITARSRAMEYLESNVQRLNIECGLQRPPLYRFATGVDETTATFLANEREALEAAGLNVLPADDANVPFEPHHGMKIDGQMQLNPLSYVQGLAKAISQLNVKIFEHSPVRDADYKHGTVTTDQATVRARHIVHATHTPKGVSLLQAQMIASREYGISAVLNDDAYPEGIFFVHDPFHSIRTYQHGGEKHLIVVGEKHQTGEGEPHELYYQRLKDYVNTQFDVKHFTHQWSNQQYSPADGLPYIGRLHGHDHAYVATGFSGDGLTWGTLGGIIISDLILDQDNRWHDHFAAKRFTPGKSAAQWLKENASVSKHLVKDYLGTEKLKALDDVGLGQGKVVAMDGEKLAVYRNRDGELSVLSAVCPHMKCLVHWNGAETSWDCPCHGSRFEATGEVIEGPAYHPLAQRAKP